MLSELEKGTRTGLHMYNIYETYIQILAHHDSQTAYEIDASYSDGTKLKPKTRNPLASRPKSTGYPTG